MPKYFYLLTFTKGVPSNKIGSTTVEDLEDLTENHISSH